MDYNEKKVDAYFIASDMRKLVNKYNNEVNNILKNIEADKSFGDNSDYWMEKLGEVEKQHLIDLELLKNKIKTLKNESIKTKKIKLSELRSLVKGILKEESENKYNIIDIDANLSDEDKKSFAFGIIKPLKK